jgi:hypothetical protein
MLIDTVGTPKLAAICGKDVVTIVPSRICMKKETATTSATILDRRALCASPSCSTVSTAVIKLPMRNLDLAAGRSRGW